MRLDEILDREDFATAICSTLAHAWTQQYGRAFDVRAASHGQQWYVQPLLSAFFTHPLSRDARRFLADAFRHTRIKRRRGPQWVLGTALASAPLLRANSPRAFTVDPAIDGSASLLVVPGNRRLRIFDVQRRTSRAVLKTGFPDEAITNEVTVRGDDAGPFAPLLASGRTWFEEPLLDGRPLSRITDPSVATSTEKAAIKLLNAWLEKHAQPMEAAVRAGMLVASLVPGLDELASRFGTERPGHEAVERLAETASGVGADEQSLVHGDFQPGNVFAARAGVLLLDWEYASTRFRSYDAFVYALDLHGGGSDWHGLDALLRRDHPGPVASLVPRWRELPWRRAAAALTALEELEHHVADALRGPFLRPPVGLGALVGALPRLASTLSGQ